MRLEELSEKNRKIYNQFVASSLTGSFLQAWEWGDWQASLGHKASRFFLYNDSEQIVLSVQVLVHPLTFGRVYLYAPFGPIMASRYELKVSDMEFVVGQLQKLFPNCVFIRFEPKLKQEYGVFLGKKTTNIQPARTLVVDLGKTREELLSAMHPKTRYNIKLALKHGVEIQQEFGVTVGHGLYTKEAIDLIVATAKRQHFIGYSRRYYHAFLDFFGLYNELGSLKVHVYKALYRQRLLAVALMVDFGETRTFLFGGSSEEFKNVMAPYLMHFQAMLDAQSLGLKDYDFWGVETAGGQAPGFVRFKLGFGGAVLEYEGARDFITLRLWYNVYTLMRWANRFFRSLFK